MKIGPNAQAVVDRLAGRPAEIIAREPNAVQATFRGLFNGAYTPGRTDARGNLTVGNQDVAAGWPASWRRLRSIGLIEYHRQAIPEGSVKLVRLTRWGHSHVHWSVTAEGWAVRMDDVAWMTEFLAADMSDKATKQ